MPLQVGDQTLNLTTPVVMTILNATPDSFYAASRLPSPEAIRAQLRTAIAEGTHIVDVGGYSTRPGAAEVSAQEELDRLLMALEVIRAEAPHLPVSIDTFRGEVAHEVMERYGACMINDITAGEADATLAAVAARFEVPYVAMHMRGMPDTMQQLTHYEDVVTEVVSYLAEPQTRLQQQGVSEVILDPGFGFAKSLEQNYKLLAGLEELTKVGAPVLAGLSRKSMIYKPLQTTPAEALNGTTALHWECLRAGASILRVHDTREAVEVIRLFSLFSQNS